MECSQSVMEDAARSNALRRRSRSGPETSRPDLAIHVAIWLAPITACAGADRLMKRLREALDRMTLDGIAAGRRRDAAGTREIGPAMFRRSPSAAMWREA